MMINQFLNYLRYERNASPQTVQTYEESLREFESYLSLRDNGLFIETADADLIRDWMESLMDKGNTASTMPQFLREGEMDHLLDGLEWDDNNYKDVRARTILLLFYEAGLRRAELIGLNDGDVDFVTGQLKVTGKRNKQRIVPFGKELAEALSVYRAVRDEQGEKSSDAFFLNDKGDRMTAPQVYSLVRKYLSAVTSLKKRSPHVLRHTFATAMLNHGADLESIKNLLGHESVSTTEIYAHTTFEQLKRIYKEAHPRA